MIEELERASERGGFSVVKMGRESKNCLQTVKLFQNNVPQK